MVSADWLKTTELFKMLSESQLNLLLSLSSMESFPEGKTIFRQGDEANHLYFLIQGAVNLSIKTGEKFDFMTSKIEKEGVAFGIPSLIEPFRYNMTAICSKSSKILVIDAGRVRMEMEKDLKMGMEIMKKLASIYFNRLSEMRSGVSNFLRASKLTS